MSKNRHYTPLEKKIFLDVLKVYKDIIEVKKSDSASLSEKVEAWKKIVEHYNNSQNITQERSITQLKKLWCNIKSTQRNAITKEKQSRMATGGGPEETPAEIDPDVSEIAPHLMITAPVLFSSNINKSPDEREITQEINYSDQNSEQYEDILNHDTNVLENSKKENKNGNTGNISEENNFDSNATKKRKLNENDLKIERIHNIIKQEKEFGALKRKNEEALHELKIIHCQELHAKEMEMKNEIYKYQILEAKHKAELAEFILRKEKN